MVKIEYINLAGVKMPVLGIGTWGMGGESFRDTSNDEQEINAIKTAIELGMTHIDTAEIYGMGHAEELVGQAIEGFERKRLFITTKAWHTHLGYSNVISAAKASLRRMAIEYIDLYLIHWPNQRYPIKETMRAFDFLVNEGVVKFIGVSNFSVEQLKEAQSFSENKIVNNQVEYHLLERGPEKELLPYCQQNDILLTAYSPVARGKLAKPGYAVLDRIAQKYSKTQAQVAINWLLSHKNVITIPKASSIEHIKENLGALGWKMKKEDVEELNRNFN